MVSGATINNCPSCGCNDVEELRVFQSWGEPHVKMQCGHCRHVWSAPMPEMAPSGGIYFPLFICRECGGRMTVASTQSEIRHMKCKKCGRTSKAAGKEILL